MINDQKIRTFCLLISFHVIFGVGSATFSFLLLFAIEAIISLLFYKTGRCPVFLSLTSAHFFQNFTLY